MIEYNLGWFLIDTDRNVEEGLELVDKAPVYDHEVFLHLEEVRKAVSIRSAT